MTLVSNDTFKGVELARLHSKAVDYVKTGVPAELEKKLMPKQFPHFMEKNARKTYRSFKILGQMYDAVNRIQFTPQYDAPFDSRILTRYALDGAMLKKARHLKTQYDTALKRIMGQMQIRTEFEALSAFIMSKPVVGTQFKQHETVRRETDALKQQFKDDCIEAAGGSREFKMLAPFVAAMYQVTHEEVQIALYESRTPHIRKNGKQSRRQIKPESMPLISFPWLFDGILGRIARGSTETEQHVDTTSTGTRKTSSAQPKATTSLDYDGLKNMEYARTSSGIVHRGQILRLFQHEDEDEDEDVANQVEEDLQQPQSQQQQKTRPLIAEHIEERDERLPKDDANATIRINLGLRTSVSPSAPTGPATDKVYNHSEATLPGHRTGGEECSLEQPCLRTQSGEPTAATNTTTSTRVTTSSTEPHSRCFGVPDEDLISFDSPTKPKQLTNGGLDFTTLSASLMDMDGEYPAPLGVQAKEYLHGLLIDFNDGGDRAARSETVNGAIGTEELIPVAGLLDDNNETPTASWSSPIQVSAVKAVSASSSKTVNGTTEQDGDVADDDDLEIEEVFMEKKAASSAFEDLANLGLTDGWSSSLSLPLHEPH
jgi:RNA-dependent RNA polymerase